MIIGDGYMVELRGYDTWAKEVIPLVRLKHIWSAFHPEAGVTTCNDKCHQLRLFIKMFNAMAN